MKSNSTNNPGMLTGLFNDKESAERAYQGLTARGYTKDDINVVMAEETRKRHFSGTGAATTELGNKAAEGAGIGGAAGGAIGATLAAIAAVGSNLVLPGLGLVVAGPLAAAAGAGAGAATGGLLGALVGWNIPEERVNRYESGIKQGGILMGVNPRSEDDADYFEQHWSGNNAQDIYRPGSDLPRSATSDTPDTVIGVYDNTSDANDAVQALVAAGFLRANVRLSSESDAEAPARTTASGTDQSNESGIGGFFRSLFGMDEHKEQHDMYAESVRRGSCVLTVDARSEEEADRATAIMDRFNPTDIDERSSQWKQQGWSGYDASAPRLSRDEIEKERSTYAQTRQTSAPDTSRIPVIEETLNVGKREVQRGGVRVFQRMSETPVRESVQLRKEQVKVSRRPVDKPVSQADLAAFKEGSIELRETSEEAVVSKTARVVEEVVIGKEVSQKTEQINDTVRRTDVDIERLGAAGSADDALTADDAEYRRHWHTAYGTSGERYEDYDAAYRYGSTMAGSDRYRNLNWTEVEPQLRSDWETNHPDSTWQKVKDAVRYGAERVTGNRHH